MTILAIATAALVLAITVELAVLTVELRRLQRVPAAAPALISPALAHRRAIRETE
jgi:hypothetical protein